MKFKGAKAPPLSTALPQDRSVCGVGLQQVHCKLGILAETTTIMLCRQFSFEASHLERTEQEEASLYTKNNGLH